MAPFIFADKIYNSKALQKYGNGQSLRDYTYVADIANGVVSAIFAKLDCEVINLGRSDPIILDDLINTISKNIGKPPVIEQLDNQPGDALMTAAEGTKAKQLLNFQPTVDFETGIQSFVHWYTQDYEKRKQENNLRTEKCIDVLIETINQYQPGLENAKSSKRNHALDNEVPTCSTS